MLVMALVLGLALAGCGRTHHQAAAGGTTSPLPPTSPPRPPAPAPRPGNRLSRAGRQPIHLDPGRQPHPGDWRRGRRARWPPSCPPTGRIAVDRRRHAAWRPREPPRRRCGRRPTARVASRRTDGPAGRQSGRSGHVVAGGTVVVGSVGPASDRRAAVWISPGRGRSVHREDQPGASRRRFGDDVAEQRPPRARWCRDTRGRVAMWYSTNGRYWTRFSGAEQ